MHVNRVHTHKTYDPTLAPKRKKKSRYSIQDIPTLSEKCPVFPLSALLLFTYMYHDVRIIAITIKLISF